MNGASIGPCAPTFSTSSVILDLNVVAAFACLKAT